MGAIVNTVKDTQAYSLASNTRFGRHGCGGRFCHGLGVMQKISKSSSQNLGGGSKACPAVGDIMGVGERVTQGDFNKAALNGGLLALYMVPAVGGTQATVKTASNGIPLIKVANLSCMQHSLKKKARNPLIVTYGNIVPEFVSGAMS